MPCFTVNVHVSHSLQLTNAAFGWGGGGVGQQSYTQLRLLSRASEPGTDWYLACFLSPDRHLARAGGCYHPPG